MPTTITDDFNTVKAWLHNQPLSSPPRPHGCYTLGQHLSMAKRAWEFMGQPTDEFGQIPDYIFEAVEEVCDEVCYGVQLDPTVASKRTWLVVGVQLLVILLALTSIAFNVWVFIAWYAWYH